MAKTRSTYNNVVWLRDEKPQATEGGAFTSGADRTRVLNASTPSSLPWWISLSANQFTLQPGSYQIDWMFEAYDVDRHQTMLYSVTGTVVLKRGSSSYANTIDTSEPSWGNHRFSISAVTAFEMRHRCNITNATQGFGVANNFGAEIYGEVRVEKLA